MTCARMREAVLSNRFRPSVSQSVCLSVSEILLLKKLDVLRTPTRDVRRVELHSALVPELAEAVVFCGISSSF